MITFVCRIKQLFTHPENAVKMIMLFESFHEQKDIENLCEKIIFAFADKIVKLAAGHKEIIPIPDVLFSDIDDSNSYTQHMTDEWASFRVRIITKDDKMYNTAWKGVVSESDKSITLRLDPVPQNLVSKAASIKDRELVASALRNAFIKDMVHEMKHVYDMFGGIETPVIQNQGRMIELMDKDNLTEEERKELITYTAEYMNTDFEISARFVETVKAIRFFNHGLSGHVMLPYARVLQMFKEKFKGYSILPDIVRHKLLSKLKEYYEIEKQNLGK